jgi:hypothetical protein
VILKPAHLQLAGNSTIFGNEKFSPNVLLDEKKYSD